MTRTKTVCTIGPATQSREMLRELIEAGMDVARLNFSHGSHLDHRNVIAHLRQLANESKCPLAILQDLAGPKIRTGPLAQGPINLIPDQLLTLTNRDVPGDDSEISVTYKRLHEDVRTGDTLLLNDGAIMMTVEKIQGSDIVCRVVVGGILSSNKGINLPTRSMTAHVPTRKDIDDLEFGLAEGVDYVAVSFVRSPDDIQSVKRIIANHSRQVPVVAKIEQREAVDRIDEILDVVDGIMIARGDLGVEIPLESVPAVQKRVIAMANRAGKPVITATQMLRSMVDSPQPTRAEVSDVANAILDGSDAVMLSEETAIGRNAIASVQMIDRIAQSTELQFPFDTWSKRYRDPVACTPEEAVAHAACQMAVEISADAIVTFTQSGSTTRLVAKYRPQQPILALTPEPETCRRLSLTWGAIPLLIDPLRSTDDLEGAAIRAITESGLVRRGGKVIITAGLPLHVSGTTNLIKIAQVP